MGETLRAGIETDVLEARLAFNKYFDIKHESCFVRGKGHSIRDVGTKYFLVDQSGCEVFKPKQRCGVFQRQFYQLVSMNGRTEKEINFGMYQDRLP